MVGCKSVVVPEEALINTVGRVFHPSSTGLAQRSARQSYLTIVLSLVTPPPGRKLREHVKARHQGGSLPRLTLGTTVIAVTKAPSTSWEIVVGSALLLAGAAVALVASRSKEFAPLKEQMDLYGRFGAYVGALFAYIGVLTELGSSLRTLGLITAAALIIFLVAILVAGGILRHRARFDEQTEERPEPQAEGSQQAMRRVGADGQEAGTPEEVAVDGDVPKPSGR
jgi:hypothetical protein